ncbi:hypothetical protein CgunFtcFv8_020130 [Champsocephalus gunnari]|uniref:Uncharacterized protein n=1 Tax=Champsocephalus gunnari TaxID=52237 RepID=A0AAN8DMT4_CHAGU|nr:hypothetical protein CgunFtcFv8_020130 [Champsocephalus gunnari]
MNAVGTETRVQLSADEDSPAGWTCWDLTSYRGSRLHSLSFTAASLVVQQANLLTDWSSRLKQTTDEDRTSSRDPTSR